MSHPSKTRDSLLEYMRGAEPEYARRARRGGLGSFVDFAMHNRSVSARGVIMRAASDGLLGLHEFDALLGSITDSAARGLAVELMRTLEPKFLLAVAALMGNQRLYPHDVHEAVKLYSLVLEAHGHKAFTRQDRMLYLELLSELGLHDEFEAAFSTLPLGDEDWMQAMLMMANLSNPWEGKSGDSRSLATWRRLTSTLFHAAGVEAIDIAPTQDAPFDSILCSSIDEIRENGPRVSILVPTHNPGRRLGTALASLVNQTWQNFEVLLLDDGSDVEHRWYMDAWAERDSRIRVLRMPGNVGNYAARNIGVQQASGDLVTVHDDDDWSHPRKLELQVLDLVDNPDTLANMSQLVRTTDALRFTRINKNPSFVQPNYSSLMFRRAEVLDAIGYWHEVNRDADAEFRHRLTAWSGVAPTVVGSAPMSFLRVREGSLTSGEIHRGYVDPRRRWYQLSTGAWREDNKAVEGGLYLAPCKQEHKFSVPQTMYGAGRSTRVSVDIVYATDFRFPGGNTSLSINEIRTLLDNGHRVGIMQLDSPVLTSNRGLTDQIRELSLHPGCVVVTLRDEVACNLLIVRHPTVMQFAEPTRSKVSADQAVLIVNHPPAMRDGSLPHYDLATCVDNFRAVFGQDPLVAPESGVIRDCLQGEVEPDLMAGFDWNGMISVKRRPPRRADAGRAPVIGRHSRDNTEKWPTDPTVLEAVYPIDGSVEVRILGGADIPQKVLGKPTPGWNVHPFGSLDAQSFLETVDFWVYFHADYWIESFGMATAEAMASGAVVILPHYMESTFGPGAVYCKPEEVQRVVQEIWADSAKYEEQSARGIDVATTRFTVETFLQRVVGLAG